MTDPTRPADSERSDRRVIRKSSGELRIPNSIYTYMQRPQFLRVSRSEGAILLERKFDGTAYRTLGHNILRRRQGWRNIQLRSNDWSEATFADPHDLVPDGEYEIGDYYPLFQLFPIESGAPATPDRGAVNAHTWESIADYHEHLGLADQHSTAHEVSKLMAKTVGKRLPKPTRILELGCGAGRNLYWMSEAFPDAEIVGVDINPSAGLQDFLPKNVRFVQQNILTLDFEQLGDFDVIFTCGFLMHINHEDVRALLENIDAHSDYSLFFELHGPANNWDFHRYPRAYDSLFDDLKLPVDSYVVFGPDDVYSHDLAGPFSHALLESSHRRAN